MMQPEDVKKIVDETLRYLGRALFDIHVTEMKVVVNLYDDGNVWFLYSSKAQRMDIVGAVVCALMDRVRE